MQTGNDADLETASLPEALGLRGTKELVSIVGGGGKSALLFKLGEVLPGFSVLTTTTRIFASQTGRARLTCHFGTPELERALGQREAGLLVIGEVEGDKAKGVSVDVPGTLLRTDGVDFVVVEADGSRMRPAKAPADHEPVVAQETTLFVIVAGIDALNAPIRDTCHRPERVAALLGLETGDVLDAAGLSELLCHPRGGLKGAPNGSGSRIALFINKVETTADWLAGRAIAESCRQNPRIDRVVVGALEPAASARMQSDSPAELKVWLGIGVKSG